MKTLSTTIEIDATPEEVWDVLVDFASHQHWDPFFSRIVGDPIVGQRIKITARKGDGDGMSFSPTILEADRGRILRWKGKLGISGIFDGEHAFELTELDNRRTRLDHGETFTGILVPFMGRLLAETKDGFVSFNNALADEVAARREANCKS